MVEIYQTMQIMKLMAFSFTEVINVECVVFSRNLKINIKHV